MLHPETDPCDGWQRAAGRGYIWPAERHDPVCLEGFSLETATPVLAKFLMEIKTDFARWSHDADWTLESGPDDAPSSIEIMVPYNYSGGGPDYFAFGCWNPGDDPEVETGTPWFVDDAGQFHEVNLTEAERERVETWICENPPADPDYGDDW